MLTELCAELKNYFLRDREADIHYGEYTISGGSIDLPFLLDGQYFRIVGSVLNDGVYQYPTDSLANEVFTGAVWSMAVPPHVVELSARIDEWSEKNKDSVESVYQSESFGGYSYSKAEGANGGFAGWRDVFRSELNKYRKL